VPRLLLTLAILSLGIVNADAQLLPRQAGAGTESEAPTPTAPQQSSSTQSTIAVAGTWQTDWGTMILSGTSSVSGTYSHQSGQVSGSLRGRRMEGHWFQGGISAKKCPSSQFGTYYWGRITVDFAADGRSFVAGWGYCDEAPSRGGWSGSR
jgi:hypothetical protein